MKRYRLVGPDGQEYASDEPGKLGGNRRDGIYGRLDCGAARQALQKGQIYRTIRVFFADEATAVQAGYRPCGRCMREQYRDWKLARA